MDFKDKMMYWDDVAVAMHSYEPREVDDRTVSTKDTIVDSMTLNEQLMLNIFNDMYDEKVQTLDISKNEEEELEEGLTSVVPQSD